MHGFNAGRQDMNEDDMRTLPPDAPHHRATDDPCVPRRLPSPVLT